ncbi:cyclic lactone autoinducer peptide [Paenibacillus eucommiae]|uniref:Cyclic lactone autoinducer peptide n=1 Tax=Paenibacillus eucommiae TaxID=1355755 RepID=A0ABS4IX00_9BACL|nr:cyclic lactone autoinducer peptide [Paenibacillus eucommiae]MBP1991391.1 cyclic lactone autoinducer peptide [Paenibacillus eucommiae]
MKKIAAKAANTILNSIAKQLGKTNCWFGCYRQDVPQELMK